MEVSLCVRQMLIRHELPSFEQRKSAIESYLEKTLQLTDERERLHMINTLVDESGSLFDVLLTLLQHHDVEMQKLGLEVYIRRTYRSYIIHELSIVCRRKNEEDIDDSTNPYLLYAEFKFSQADIHSTTLNGNPSSTPGASIPSSLPTSSTSSFGLSYNSSQRMISPESADDLMLLEREKRTAKLMSRKLSSHSTLAALASISSPASPDNLRYGLMMVFRDIEEAKQLFDWAMEAYIPPPRFSEDSEFFNILNIFLLDQRFENVQNSEGELSDAFLDNFSQFLKRRSDMLRSLAVRRATLAINRPHDFPDHYTFREREGYGEDLIYRHMEPPLAYHLELRRLSNYTIHFVPTTNKQLHLYYAQQKGKEHLPTPQCNRRFFVRAMVRGGNVFSNMPPTHIKNILHAEGERVFSEVRCAVRVSLLIVLTLHFFYGF